jgi:hypothetical protein
MLLPWCIILVVAGQVKPGAWRAPVLWTTLALVVALMLAALVLAIVDHWRKRRARSDRLSPGEQLSHFRSLYEKGELSREEYERIRTLLGGRLREELQLPAARPAETAQAPGPQTGIQALDERMQPPPPPPPTAGPTGTEEQPPPPPPAPPGTDNGPPGA